MGRWTTERGRRALPRLGLALGLAALLIGAVGAHVIHSYVHPTRAAEAGGPVQLDAGHSCSHVHCELADGHDCPVCHLLDQFHASATPQRIDHATRWAASRHFPYAVVVSTRRTNIPFLSRAPPRASHRS